MMNMMTINKASLDLHFKASIHLQNFPVFEFYLIQINPYLTYVFSCS